MAPDVEKRILQREAREQMQHALQDMSLRWLQFAANPDHAAFAKWTLFLGDVYVVGAPKVINTAQIWQHFDLIGQHALGSAPTLTKAVSRSPAMIEYLDLNQNRREAPNENFDRELFELFVLREGPYSENDIREAARAFTGYRARLDQFTFIRKLHDSGAKTVFKHTGRFTGDQVIDLAYLQPAAGIFLPHELVEFYLSDTPRHARCARRLVARAALRFARAGPAFFWQPVIFSPEYRGNFIKSPVQLYLGLLQDLDLNVTPLPRPTLTALRQMGQLLYNPPNVRGWVGGRNWINSATLAARRRLVESLFTSLNEERLNADEQRELAAVRTSGLDRFTVSPAQFSDLAKLAPAAAADELLGNFLALPASSEFRDRVSQFLSPGTSDQAQRHRRVRRAATVLLQSPEYQLC